MSQPNQGPRKIRKRQEGRTDPIRRLTEWQDHLYDPGYFTGGNIDPLLTGERPNKYGYLLIFAGIVMVIFMAVTVTKETLSWPILIAGIPFAALVLLAGFKLIRKQSPTKRLSEQRSDSDNLG